MRRLSRLSGSLSGFLFAFVCGLPSDSGALPLPQGPSVHLYGVVWRSDGGVALIQFRGGRARPLRPGEVRAGWTLVEIRRCGVLLRSRTGAVVEVPLAESASVPDLQPARPPDPAASGPDASSSPLPEPAALPAHTSRPPPGESGAPGEALLRFSREEVRLRLTTELPRILSEALVLPRVRGSEIAGLELVSFPLDTVLGQTGLLPGDVVLAVNGREVRGIESLGVLLQRFQSASHVEVMLDRAGRILSLRYEIQ